MTPAARLARIADMIDDIGSAPVDELPKRLDALRMEVHRAERECAEVDPRAVTGADIARQVIEETRKLVAP